MVRTLGDVREKGDGLEVGLGSISICIITSYMHFLQHAESLTRVVLAADPWMGCDIKLGIGHFATILVTCNCLH